MNPHIRKIIGLLGVGSLSAGSFMLYAGNDWEASLLALCLGFLLLMEYKAQDPKDPN